jgi:HK97 gp10 family phage protein
MAKSFTFQFEGLDKALSKLKDLPDDIKEGVVEEIKDTGRLVIAKAKRRAPVNKGPLQQRTDLRELPTGDGVELFSATDYAAFVEFGTGGLVDVPKGLESYAMQFKGKGIKQVNLRPRPFFFNSFFEEKPKLLQRIKNVLKLK